MDSLSWSAPTKRSMQHATVTVFYAVKYSLTKSNLGLTWCPAMFGRQTGGWNHQPLHQYLLYPRGVSLCGCKATVTSQVYTNLCVFKVCNKIKQLKQRKTNTWLLHSMRKNHILCSSKPSPQDPLQTQSGLNRRTNGKPVDAPLDSLLTTWYSVRCTL